MVDIKSVWVLDGTGAGSAAKTVSGSLNTYQTHDQPEIVWT
jgi:hypothetical protein